jgi:hypothetical protein
VNSSRPGFDILLMSELTHSQAAVSRTINGRHPNRSDQQPVP